MLPVFEPIWMLFFSSMITTICEALTLSVFLASGSRGSLVTAAGMMKMMSRTSTTSVNGVMLIVAITSSSPWPVEMATIAPQLQAREIFYRPKAREIFRRAEERGALNGLIHLSDERQRPGGKD